MLNANYQVNTRWLYKTAVSVNLNRRDVNEVFIAREQSFLASNNDIKHFDEHNLFSKFSDQFEIIKIKSWSINKNI